MSKGTIETLASINRGSERESVRACGRVVWYECEGPDASRTLRTKRKELQFPGEVLAMEWLKGEELAAVLARVTGGEGGRLIP